MDPLTNNVEIAERFAVVARQYCAIVDAASGSSREKFLTEVYSILPRLIDQAISLPDIELKSGEGMVRDPAKITEAARLRHPEWQRRYHLLGEKLGNWNSYQMVFNPTQNTESLSGSFADDLTGIYCDLKKALVENEAGLVSPQNSIWEWRFSFCSHWGRHAIDALKVIHVLIHYS